MKNQNTNSEKSDKKKKKNSDQAMESGIGLLRSESQFYISCFDYFGQIS